MQAVQAGRPRVVLVEGAAGMGKSSLLSRFVSEHRDICLLRASGDEAEMLLAWGLADQLLAGAGAEVTGRSAQDGSARGKDADAMAVGAQLVTVRDHAREYGRQGESNSHAGPSGPGITHRVPSLSLVASPALRLTEPDTLCSHITTDSHKRFTALSGLAKP